MHCAWRRHAHRWAPSDPDPLQRGLHRHAGLYRAVRQGARERAERDWPFFLVKHRIAAGKGFGDFNIQANVQLPWPTSNYNALGTQLAANVAFQWHLFKYFWPEIELNYTTWINGPRNGLDQLFITFDAIIGPFRIPGTRIKPAIVVGYQRALTPSPAVLNPLTPVYSQSFLVGARMFF